MIIECVVPFLLVGLYRAMMNGLTIPTSIRVAATDGPWTGGVVTGGGISSFEVIAQYIAYSVVLSILLVATFIDIDERTIPDSITIPGTWLGLFASTWIPGWTLWEVRETAPPAVRMLEPMQAGSPYAWETQWGQHGPTGIGLWIGLLIWWIWCLSLGNLRWIGRRGMKKAWVYAWVGFWRSPNLPVVFGMAIVGSILITASYFGLSAERWQGLFSSLMGIGLGGLLVWSFRIVAGGVLGQEALGFGDVTLMAMVGAHFGWQIVLLAFFLAPLFGVALVIAYWVITRDSAIPFGPYLAAATAYLMLDWARVWDAVSIVFVPVRIYLLFLAVLLVLLGTLLWLVRALKVLWLTGR
jgi:prepilin signal peptidase PulO-like enzyme (type II secretory pathway)